jgi:uncharacterized RDD family membrane protein YckC
VDIEEATVYPWEQGGDLVVFETPEQTQVEYRIAPFGTRLVAAFVDSLIIMAISLGLMIMGAVVGSALGVITGSGSAGAFVAILFAFQAFLGILYYAWGEVRGEGQTWGKRLARIRTVMTTGQGVTLGAALIRNFARLVDQFPFMWLVPTMSQGGRRMGDLLAGTYVVLAADAASKPAVVDWPAETYGGLEDRLIYFGGEVAQKLFRDDLNLIEYLLIRIRDAEPRRRGQLMRAVAKRYLDRLAFDDEQKERVLKEPRRFFLELGLFLKSRYEGQAF